jgi:anaerobic selenocysteine-containing dehydrogenase
MRTVRSFCRVCTSVCGILVEVDGDDVIAVHGDGEHPFSHGYTCPKGRALPQIHHHPDRLEHPQMRIDGTLHDTTWEACLDDLGAKLRDTIDNYGPESVGINFGTGVGMDAVGYRIAQSLHAAIGTPAKFSPLTIDGTAKVLMAELMGGSSALTGRPDYDNAAFAMLIGSNPVVSHGHTVGLPNPRGAIRDLAKHAEVWVVDPRYTETARLATHHLAPRPGADYAVLAYLVREVLRDGVKAPAQDVDALAAAVAHPAERDDGDFDTRATDEGSARAARRHPVGHPQPAGLGAAHGSPRRPCGTTPFDVVGAGGDRPTRRPRTGRHQRHRRGDARAGELGRARPI